MRFSVMKLFDWSFTRIASRWVHPSVDVSSSAFIEHARFIGSQALIGSSIFFVAPAYLALQGSGSELAAGALSAFSLPLFWSYLVSKTGRLDWGIKGMLVSLAFIIAFTCIFSGGVSSLFLPLLCILPLEASIRTGRRGAVFGALLALLSVAGVFIAPTFASLSSFQLSGGWLSLSQISVIIAVIYSFSLALRIGSKIVINNDQLSEAENRFRLLADNATDLITRHDESGATLFASPAARPLFGSPASSLMKSGMFEKIHLQDRIIFMKSISRAAHDGKEQSCHFRIRCKGTTGQVWKWVEMRSHLERVALSNKVSVIAVTRDITNSREQEISIKETTEASEEANLAQRRFLTTMSHELRTPLNAILGFSDILKQELFGKLPFERHAEYVGMIHESGQHLLNVVNDLLDISRIESGKYELSLQTFPIIDIADSTLKMMQPLAAKAGVTVLCDVLPTLPEITADRRSCQQILINLVSNAIKFTPEGGNVRVSAHQHGRSLKLRVKDNGIGIEESFLSTIGQPFMQGDHGYDREYEGSGLGLSVVKGLVALHRGDFEILSTQGEGTTVTITLPLKSRASTPIPANEEAQLVHLNDKAAKKTQQQLHTSTLRKGDNHARISA